MYTVEHDAGFMMRLEGDMDQAVSTRSVNAELARRACRNHGCDYAAGRGNYSRRENPGASILNVILYLIAPRF